ncbi:hypothetical protein [Mycobacterium parmense]|uniref:hypothetical protein n=1 Tax=Mycobacterium parmense TaxID=185642 RepID=UPI00111C55B9|nr:hypothetical protein [Mycobacterium parmense]MCV7348718.1 hypothetical protein [Mycobacterium parmense]
MTSRKSRTTVALCGVVAAFAFAFGVAPDATRPATALASSSEVPPPLGGGACIIGLNCGCIRNITCPPPHVRRPTAPADQQHAAPPPESP